MINLASRLAHIEPFHVMEIAAHARALEAAGRDVMHMEIGEPDFPTPPPVIDAAQMQLASGQIYYTSALGIRPLRDAISEHYKRTQGFDIAAERIIVRAGGSAALLLTCALLVNRDDEILLADPWYPCHRHFVRVMDGVPKTIATGPDKQYQFAALPRNLIVRRARRPKACLLRVRPIQPEQACAEENCSASLTILPRAAVC